MGKFTDALVGTLQGHFDAGDQPTEAQFDALILAIQEGIEEHDHDGTGDGDGITTLAGVLTLDLANSRVGINQAAPEKEVHIAGAASANIVFERLGTAQKGYFAHLGSTLQLAINREIGGVFSDAAKAAASINMVGAAASSYIDFYTKDANNVAPDRRLRIDKVGAITIGDLAGANQPVGADAAGKLYVPHVSDRKFKDNIKPLIGGLEVVRELRAVTFDWNAGELAKMGLDFGEAGQQVGLIAQEVQAAAPLAGVHGSRWESYSDRAILGYLIEAIKANDARLTQGGL